MVNLRLDCFPRTTQHYRSQHYRLTELKIKDIYVDPPFLPAHFYSGEGVLDKI